MVTELQLPPMNTPTDDAKDRCLEQWTLVVAALREVGFTYDQCIAISGNFARGYRSRWKFRSPLTTFDPAYEAEQALVDAVEWGVPTAELPKAWASGELQIKFMQRHQLH